MAKIWDMYITTLLLVKTTLYMADQDSKIPILNKGFFNKFSVIIGPLFIGPIPKNEWEKVKNVLV